MVHASLRAVGAIDGGPQVLLDALIEALGPDGTLMAFVSWDRSPYDLTLGCAELPVDRIDVDLRFNPADAAPYPGFGAFNRFICAHPAVERSLHPDASMAAIGRNAAWLVTPHRLGEAYGRGSPVERFLETNGMVLTLGSGPDAITVLHYAEAAARIAGKRRVSYWMPPVAGAGDQWQPVSDWDSNGILDEFTTQEGPDAVECIAREYLELGRHLSGPIGNAHAQLIDATDIVQFGIQWLEQKFGDRLV